jgi:hypothetical protein
MLPVTDTQWQLFGSGSTVGGTGSEAGVILRDEEHVEGARITLERSETKRFPRRPVVRYAITCGIYGWMVHTRFFASDEQAVREYDRMKPDLAAILAQVPLLTDPDLESKMDHVTAEIRAFIERFP